MARSPRVPTYRKHSSGQARVTLGGKDYLLGTYGSPQSHEAYRRLIAEHLENSKALDRDGRDAPPLTVNELLLKYWEFADTYYGFAGSGRGDAYCLRHALGIVRSLYGRTAARDFGPLALKACRRVMLEKDWSRSYTNAQVDRVRRMFRWAAEEELVPGGVYQALRAVAGLRPGKSAARETEKVVPVPPEHVEAARLYMPPAVRAMVRLQLLTGCRPAEVCVLRPLDLDRSDPACWVYRPGSDRGPHGAHKTAHRGRDRLILIGPRGQEVLRPFLDLAADAYCFSPARSEAERNSGRRAARVTPRPPSQRARRPAARRRRAPSDRYDTHSYRRAIARACRKADAAAHRQDASVPATQAIVPTWSPNQLRHSRATELRPYGLDLAKTVLGHSKVETTLIYAEKDLRAAKELVTRIG
jgi:integrase